MNIGISAEFVGGKGFDLRDEAWAQALLVEGPQEVEAFHLRFLLTKFMYTHIRNFLEFPNFTDPPHPFFYSQDIHPFQKIRHLQKS